MASAIPKGKGSWLLTVSLGYDAQGKKKRIQRVVKLDPTKTMNAQRREAEKLAAELETDSARQVITDAKRVTVNDLAQDFLDNHCKVKGLSSTTIEGYRWLLNARILPCIGKMPVRDVTPHDITDLYVTLSETAAKTNRSKTGKLSGTTQLHYHRLLHILFGYAVRCRYITLNPVDAVDPPRKDTQETQFYELEDCAKLLNALDSLEDEQWRLFFYMSIYTGMRPGEIIGLDWEDINFKTSTLTVRAGCAYIKGVGTIRTDRQKTQKSIRVIDLPKNILQMLAYHHQVQAEYMADFGGDWPEPDAVFTGALGKRLDKSSPTQKFQKIVKANNLRPITLYGLRHTAATIMIAEGLSARDVAARLGHAQTSTTLNIYAHAFADANSRATVAISDALARARGKTAAG